MKNIPISSDDMKTFKQGEVRRYRYGYKNRKQRRKDKLHPVKSKPPRPISANTGMSATAGKVAALTLIGIIVAIIATVVINPKIL